MNILLSFLSFIILTSLFFIFILLIILWSKIHALEKENQLIKRILEELKPTPTAMPQPTDNQTPSPKLSIKKTSTAQTASLSKPAKPLPSPSITSKSLSRSKKKKSFLFKKELFSVESIISKLGIFLLLIGVGFIFKLAYTHGYITESLALIIGASIGGLFLLLAFKVRKKKRLLLSQVLSGGGLAIFYITTYAAYQVYGLIPDILAFIFMVTITLLSFFIALLINSQSMAVIGVLGGLLTPFLIQLKQLDLFGMGLYVTLLAVAAMIIYAFKKWRILQLSSVVGTLSVTSYFMTLKGLSLIETQQLAILLILLFVIFNGVDYLLQYMNYASLHFKNISFTLFIAIPLITLLQIINLLDLSDSFWAISLAGVALIYLGLTYVLHRKIGPTFVTDISLSFVGVFTLLALVNFFGENILTLTTFLLSLLFYFAAKKIGDQVMWFLGHIIFILGSAMAISDMVRTIEDQHYPWTNFLVGLLILLVMLVAIWLNKALIRKILAVFSLQFYLPIFLIIYLVNLNLYHAPTASVIIFYGCFISCLYLLNRKWPLLPNNTLLIGALLPFVAKLFSVAEQLTYWTIDVPVTVAYILYGFLLYLLTHYLTKTHPTLIRLIIKLSCYGLVSLTLLANLTIYTGYFSYGLFLFGGFILLITRYEPDRLSKSFTIYIQVHHYMWLTLFSLYLILMPTYLILHLIPQLIDILLLFLLYYFLEKILQKYLLIRTVLHSFFYMLLIHKILIHWSFGTGIITLLWAAYALILLSYYVVKVQVKLVNYGLLMIIFVATKFIVVDLSGANILLKIIVSMVFGAALLVLSYLLQPLLAKSNVKAETLKKES